MCVCVSVPPTSTDLSVFLRNLFTMYGQKVKNTDVKSAPEGVASITANSGLERYTENSRKIRKLRSLPTDWCKGDLEALVCVCVCTLFSCICGDPKHFVHIQKHAGKFYFQELECYVFHKVSLPSLKDVQYSFIACIVSALPK